MFKKTSVSAVAAIAVCFVLCAGFALSQQEPTASRQFEQINSQLQARMDRLEANQKLILQKLDAVQSDQQKILGELDIVKIRATRR